MDWKLYVLEYQSTAVADFNTSPTVIHIANHGLRAGDMIVNTTRRTSYTAERGSRAVSATNLNTDDFQLVGSGIADQAYYDYIRLYKYIDRSSLIKSGSLTLNRKVAGESDCTFTMITTASGFIPRAGQRIKLTRTTGGTETNQFLGFISNVERSRPDLGRPEIFLSITCYNLSKITTRRTVRVNYPIGTSYGTIVSDMITGYLTHEGIRTGTINTGAALDDDWTDDTISISNVLDRCSNASAFQWFVDDLGYLQFLKDITISLAEHNLEEDTSFKDFTNIKITETVEDYANRMSLTGGTDGYGNAVIVSGSNLTDINARQNIEAGTGVYGTVISEVSINEAEYHVAEATTTSSYTVVSAHGQEVGWMIWNITRGAYATITSVGGLNNFDIAPAITGQVAGDQLVFFSVASDIIKTALRKQSTMPMKLSFTSGTTDWTPGKKLRVVLPSLAITESYWLIESVSIFDNQQANGNLRCNVVATLRDNTDFCTQRNIRFLDYFKKLN